MLNILDTMQCRLYHNYIHIYLFLVIYHGTYLTLNMMTLVIGVFEGDIIILKGLKGVLDIHLRKCSSSPPPQRRAVAVN